MNLIVIFFKPFDLGFMDSVFIVIVRTQRKSPNQNEDIQR